ncbi:MAG: ferrous iron transport protein A [Oscillospiraceae bacterium]
MRQIPLCDMKTGTYATVIKLDTKGDLRRRLMDIGLVEGTLVECVRKSPAGDPKAYLIRGAVIALRKEDAKTVLVEAAL